MPSHSTLPPSSSLDEIQEARISITGGDVDDELTRELQQFDRIGPRSLTAEEKGRIGSEAESSTEGTTSAELTNQTEQATDDGSTAIAPATAGKARDAGLPSNSPLPPSPSSDEIQEAHISSTGGDADDDLARELQQFDRIGPRNLTAEEKRGIDSETESVTAGTKSAEQANQTAQATSDEDEGSTLTSPTTAGKALDAGLPSNSTLPPSSSLDEIQEAHISITGGDADDVLTRELQQFDRIGLRSLTTEEKGGIDSDAESVTARTKSAEQTNQTAQATSDEDEGSTPTTPTTAGNAHDAGLLSNSPLPPSSSLDESQEADVAIIGGDADDELTRELQQFDSRLLHLNADATEALQESGNLVTEPSSIASIDHSPTLSAEPPATPEEENMKELTEPIQSGPTNNTMPNEPHDGYFFDESAEDDVARTLREAIQMESDPNIKAELKRSYDDYMKILKK